MARRGAVLAVLAVAAAGCGSSGGGATGTTTAKPAGDAAATTTAAQPPARSAAAQRTARVQARRYDRAFSALPYRAGPLPVAQTIVSEEQPDLLVARLSPQRFFCLGSPARRAAAIRVYYRRARARVRAQGLTDLRLEVAPLGPTAEVSVLWARAEGGRVTLTAAGRGGRCDRR
jgi:hypothetical protein